MKKIPKPSLNVKDVFLACISTVSDLAHKGRLTACTNLLEVAEKDFETKFASNDIYKIPQSLTILGSIGKKEMEIIYNYRMVQTTIGKAYYNQIILSAQFGKCPLCSVRNVDTLDHYLPKSKYPIYAVTPINLVPACSPCNKDKKVDFPKNSVEQTLHPYYDNVEAESWVKAKVLQTDPIGFEYYVSPPHAWPDILKKRVANHFDSFELRELFASHASEELRGFRGVFVNLYNSHPNLLKDHLNECYTSTALSLGKNSWKAVMYEALRNDTWYCNGGVLT